MNELIKITEQNGKQAVSVRELYDFLGFNKTQWKRWYEKNIINNPYAEENTDWQGFDIVSNGNETKDFALTIEFSKRLSMLARTDKGEKVRNFFIECEKKLIEKQKLVNLDFSNPDTVLMLAQNWKDEQQKRIQVEQQLKEQRPKVLFADAISASENSTLVRKLANVLKQNGVNIGQNRLFKWMRDNGYLCKSGERYNQPTQYSMDLGLFEVSYNTVVRPDKSFQTITTKVTGKGQIYFVEKFLSSKSALYL